MTSKSGYSSTLLRRKASAAIIYLARLLILTIVGYIVLYPFFYMLVTAIKDIDAMLDVEHIWIPVTYSLKSFKDIFELLDFGTALKQTFLVQISSAAIETFVCAFVAYGFARFKFKGFPACSYPNVQSFDVCKLPKSSFVQHAVCILAAVTFRRRYKKRYDDIYLSAVFR